VPLENADRERPGLANEHLAKGAVDAPAKLRCVGDPKSVGTLDRNKHHEIQCRERAGRRGDVLRTD
jgi:hypothetical protein